MEVSVIPFAVRIHKLKNLYKPDHYPKHTDITEADLPDTMTVMFLRKLEDAKHAIDTHMKMLCRIKGIKVDKETGPKSGNETDNYDEAEGYEEICDVEKDEPSFTSGVDNLEMDNEDESTEGWFIHFLTLRLLTVPCLDYMEP
ncbi:hypothetical protein YC2023_044425 [Brassica napus]